MDYEIELRPKAWKDLKRVPRSEAARILDRIEGLRHGLVGDVTRLKASAFEYRLRVGDYRVLFDVEGARVLVWRVRHRREAYSR